MNLSFEDLGMREVSSDFRRSLRIIPEDGGEHRQVRMQNGNGDSSSSGVGGTPRPLARSLGIGSVPPRTPRRPAVVLATAETGATNGANSGLGSGSGFRDPPVRDPPAAFMRPPMSAVSTRSSVLQDPVARYVNYLVTFRRDVKKFPSLQRPERYLAWLNEMKPYLSGFGCWEFLNPLSPTFGQHEPEYLIEFEAEILPLLIDAVQGIRQRTGQCTSLLEVMHIVSLRCAEGFHAQEVDEHVYSLTLKFLVEANQQRSTRSLEKMEEAGNGLLDDLRQLGIELHPGVEMALHGFLLTEAQRRDAGVIWGRAARRKPSTLEMWRHVNLAQARRNPAPHQGLGAGEHFGGQELACFDCGSNLHYAGHYTCKNRRRQRGGGGRGRGRGGGGAGRGAAAGRGAGGSSGADEGAGGGDRGAAGATGGAGHGGTGHGSPATSNNTADDHARGHLAHAPPPSLGASRLIQPIATTHMAHVQPAYTAHGRTFMGEEDDAHTSIYDSDDDVNIHNLS